MTIGFTAYGTRDIGLMRPVSLVSLGKKAHGGWRRAFTLLETMGLFEACTRQNRNAASATTAMLLAGHIQELMEGLPFSDPVSGRSTFGAEKGETLNFFNDVDDFDAQTLNPPIDSSRTPIPALSQYTQVITVMPVYPNQPSSNVDEARPELPKTAYTGAQRIRVKIMYKAHPADTAQEVYRAQWVRFDK